MGLSSVGIDFDTVVRSQLPRSFFVSLNDPPFVARGGIEIHARRRRRRRHKGAQNLHRSQRQRGTAAATIRERRITIQLSAAAATRPPHPKVKDGLIFCDQQRGGDRRPRCGFPRNGTKLRERGNVHAELVTASAHAHDLESLSCRGWRRDRMSRRKRKTGAQCGPSYPVCLWSS